MILVQLNGKSILCTQKWITIKSVKIQQIIKLNSYFNATINLHNFTKFLFLNKTLSKPKNNNKISTYPTFLSIQLFNPLQKKSIKTKQKKKANLRLLSSNFPNSNNANSLSKNVDFGKNGRFPFGTFFLCKWLFFVLFLNGKKDNPIKIFAEHLFILWIFQKMEIMIIFKWEDY